MLALSGAALIGVGTYAGGLALTNLRAEAARTMTVDEAHEAAASGQILLVDIRRPDEWAATGVPQNAVAIDLRDEDFVDRIRAAQASGDQPAVALICARGVRSARTTHRLAEAGISPIVDVPEGMLGSLAGPGWIARGLPLRQLN